MTTTTTKSKRLEIPVPAFFVREGEEYLHNKIEWLSKEFDMTDQFFAQIIGIEAELFTQWRGHENQITQDVQDALQEFWRVFLRVVSFYNSDLEITRYTLDFIIPSRSEEQKSRFAPPWTGTSLRTYLLENGTKGVEGVNYWISDIKFGRDY